MPDPTLRDVRIYVLVNGAVALDDGKLVDGMTAGKAVRAPERPPR